MIVAINFYVLHLAHAKSCMVSLKFTHKILNQFKPLALEGLTLSSIDTSKIETFEVHAGFFLTSKTRFG